MLFLIYRTNFTLPAAAASLKASGKYPNLEKLVFDTATAFNTAKTPTTIKQLLITAKVVKGDLTSVEQLVKIAIRVHWVQVCKKILRESIVTNTIANYPNIPVI